MSSLTRYLRLWGYFIRFSVSRSLQFRMDFFFRIVMDLIFYAVNIGFYRILFLHTPVLGGWSEPQMMVFVSGYLLVDALNMTFFTNNQWMLPVYVNRGDLDYYLIRPVSSLFFLSLRDFAVNSFINVIFASGILVWSIARYPEQVSAAKVVLFVVALGVGVLLQYCLSMLFILPVFWTHSVSGFRQMYWSLTRFVERPDGIFQGWVRRALTVFLPFCLIASFPARMALDRFSLATLAHLIGVTAGFCVVLGLCWRAGLRNYSSASS